MALPRVLVLMGSGETSPTMTKTHREVLAQVGPKPKAVLLDTAVGFQENAELISSRAVEYFAESLQQPVEIVSLRRADLAETDPLAYETALARIREAAWVFAGPGSPTYALAHWRATGVPALWTDKIGPGGIGGAVVLSSAASCTGGMRTVPVYEIYKVGAEPYWADGLDLLGAATGLRAVVIPHFDNAEGGNHDTRFCYLGERRLAVMERELPDDVWVLGLDEHTAAVFDLDAGSVRVTGNGTVTVRRRDGCAVFPAGTTVSIEDLAAAGRGAAGPGGVAAAAASATSEADVPAAPVAPSGPVDPLAAEVDEAEAAFDEALAVPDASAAARAALALDASLAVWARDTTNTAERFAASERGRAAMRSMVVRLGALAVVGTRDPREAVAPFVEAMLALRVAARAEKRWADSDAIRDRLLAAGVEIRDTPNATEWLLADR